MATLKIIPYNYAPKAQRSSRNQAPSKFVPKQVSLLNRNWPLTGSKNESLQMLSPLVAATDGSILQDAVKDNNVSGQDVLASKDKAGGTEISRGEMGDTGGITDDDLPSLARLLSSNPKMRFPEARLCLENTNKKADNRASDDGLDNDLDNNVIGSRRLQVGSSLDQPIIIGSDNMSENAQADDDSNVDIEHSIHTLEKEQASSSTFDLAPGPILANGIPNSTVVYSNGDGIHDQECQFTTTSPSNKPSSSYTTPPLYYGDNSEQDWAFYSCEAPSELGDDGFWPEELAGCAVEGNGRALNHSNKRLKLTPTLREHGRNNNYEDDPVPSAEHQILPDLHSGLGFSRRLSKSSEDPQRYVSAALQRSDSISLSEHQGQSASIGVDIIFGTPSISANSRVTSTTSNFSSTVNFAPPTGLQPATPAVDASQEWDIREIIGKEYVDGVLHYMVDWNPTLEPQDSLENAKELVDEFETRLRVLRGSRNGRGSQALKRGQHTIVETNALNETKPKRLRARPRKQQ